MNRFRCHRDVIALAAALVLPLGMAAILVPFRSSFANTASALVLVAVIVAVAVAGNRLAGLVATVSATFWFDLLLTRPYGRLAISHRPDMETAVSLFVVGVVVTELAARNRYHYEAAAEESDYVDLIYGLSELVASGAPAHEVTERARSSSSTCSTSVIVVMNRGCLSVEWPASTTTGTLSTWGWCGALTTWACPVPRSTWSSRLEDRSWAASSSGRPRATPSRSTAEW